MKTRIMITFDGESISKVVPGRILLYDGYVPIPKVGDHVRNPVIVDDSPLSGTLKSRSFSYGPDEVCVTLILEAP